MTFRLTVAHSIVELADRLADELARPLPDPFTTELLAVPGDGIKSWLTARLGRRLGATDGAADGIVANVRYVFPGGLVRRALRRDTPSDPWSVGPLTWAVHEVLVSDEPDDVDLLRCRAIADLFDRYALHRPGMIRRWEHGADVDPSNEPLPAHLRWQPALWRRLVEHLGAPSDVEAMAHETPALAAGRLSPDVPERVFLFGLTGLPDPHLRVLAALSNQVDVHVLAPAPSVAVWGRLRDHSRTVPYTPPLRRERDETVGAAAHPLGRAWGRSAREAHLQLVSTALEVDARIDVLDTVLDTSLDPSLDTSVDTTPGTPAGSTVLARLQHDLRHDVAPPGPPAHDQPDQRLERRADDHSVQWHTCHGPARQAEVLRDLVVHLLELSDPDGPRYEPRDITVLCPDPGTFGSLVEAAFRGDPDHGVPAIPLRVADRSLRQQNPVLDAAAALLGLLDARFRVNDVLAFASLEPVARRLGLGRPELELISARAVATNIHWGLDAASQVSVGLPGGLEAFTWRDGLDQLFVGAAMSDPAMAAAAGHVPAADDVTAMRFGPGSTVPADDVEGDAVTVVGVLADLVHELERATRSLTGARSVEEWIDAFSAAADSLFAVPDADSWQRRDLDHELAGVLADTVHGGHTANRQVPPAQLAALVTERLSGRPGRVRFGSGAVTVSSLTAQRGVPSPVVCLLGLDGDLGGGGSAAANDLMAIAPCVGDRDARGELRAQLLDAVLAARDHLVILSTGADVRTNAHVPAAVPLAELGDLIDQTVQPAPGSPSATRDLIVRHPRQPWAERYFVPGGFAGAMSGTGPWGFDRAALAAASARRSQGLGAALFTQPLDAAPLETVTVDDLVEVVSKPCRTLVNRRLGVTLARAADLPSDLVPLEFDSLQRWEVAASQLDVRRAAGPGWDTLRPVWETTQRRSGAVPPLVRGTVVLDRSTATVDALIEALELECGLLASAAPVSVPIDVARPHTLEADAHDRVSRPRIVGAVHGVVGDVVVDITPSRIHVDRLLSMWVRLAALVAAEPTRRVRGVVVGKHERDDVVVTHRLSLRDPGAALEVLDVVADLHQRARCQVVPAFPRTTRCLHDGDLAGARMKWSGARYGAECTDEWVAVALGTVDLDLDVLLAEPADHTEPWGTGSSRIERWAERIWGTFDRTTVWEPVT